MRAGAVTVFRAAVSEEAAGVVALAIATDTDNTGRRTTAWYGDLTFRPDETGPSR